MGEIITLVSGKGGVGKTTITANLGIVLQKAGFRVCLVDADIAMANLSLLLGMQSSPITLHDVLLGEAVIADSIYEGPAGVSFIPSGLSLDTYRRVDSERIASVIRSIQNQFDFILLDAAAGIGKDVMAALGASDKSILVTMPTSPSIADLLKTKIVAQRLGNQPIGIIMNFVRFEKGEISDTDVMKMLELPVYGVVPYDDEVRKSFLQQKVAPIVIRESDSPAALAIYKTVEKLTGKKVENFAGKKGGLSGFFMKKKSGPAPKPAQQKKPGLLSKLFGFFKKKK